MTSPRNLDQCETEKTTSTQYPARNIRANRNVGNAPVNRDFATTEKFYGAMRSAQSAAADVHDKLALTAGSPALVGGNIGKLPQCLPQDQKHESSETADRPKDQTDIAAAILAIDRLPLTDAEKAEAIRRLLAAKESRS